MPAPAQKTSSTTIRIDVARLDALLNLVGELVIDRTRLVQLGGALADQFGDREAAREFRQRHREEQEHVLFVSKVVEQFVKRELQEQPMPVTYL